MSENKKEGKTLKDTFLVCFDLFCFCLFASFFKNAPPALRGYLVLWRSPGYGFVMRSLPLSFSMHMHVYVRYICVCVCMGMSVCLCLCLCVCV